MKKISLPLLISALYLFTASMWAQEAQAIPAVQPTQITEDSNKLDIGDIIEDIVDGVGPIVNSIKTVITNIVDSDDKAEKDAATPVNSAEATLPNEVSDKFDIGDLIEDAVDGVGPIVSSIKTVITNIVNSKDETEEDTAAPVNSAEAALPTEASDKFDIGDLIEDVVDGAGPILDFIKTGIADLTNKDKKSDKSEKSKKSDKKSEKKSDKSKKSDEKSKKQKSSDKKSDNDKKKK